MTQPRIATNDCAVNHDLGVVRLGFYHKPGCCLPSDKSLEMLSYEKPLYSRTSFSRNPKITHIFHESQRCCNCRDFPLQELTI